LYRTGLYSTNALGLAQSYRPSEKVLSAMDQPIPSVEKKAILTEGGCKINLILNFGGEVCTRPDFKERLKQEVGYVSSFNPLHIQSEDVSVDATSSWVILVFRPDPLRLHRNSSPSEAVKALSAVVASKNFPPGCIYLPSAGAVDVLVNGEDMRELRTSMDSRLREVFVSMKVLDVL